MPKQLKCHSLRGEKIKQNKSFNLGMLEIARGRVSGLRNIDDGLKKRRQLGKPDCHSYVEGRRVGGPTGPHVLYSAGFVVIRK